MILFPFQAEKIFLWVVKIENIEDNYNTTLVLLLKLRKLPSNYLFSSAAMSINPNFQLGQIVSLDCGNSNLYCQVIQVVTSRDFAWVRPLLLADFTQEEPLITDLRDASDLLWPIGLFRPALDTEVISLISQLLPKEPKVNIDNVAQQKLHHFIHQAWQAHQDSKEL